MLSREDMLQELELLPAWRLRQAAPMSVEKVKPDISQAEDVVAEEAIKPELTIPKATTLFRLLLSDDTQWAFILPANHSEEAETLLQNMLKAVSVEVSQDVTEASTALLSQHTPKMIVVMGEVEAQQLLNNQQPLTQLRGKAHPYESASVIATYPPSYLLQHLQDKAKAWEDLCLAKLTITNL